MYLELQLPPGRTTAIQFSTRMGNVAVGTPVAGVPIATGSSIYRFDLTWMSAGDYNAQLTGVSIPSGLPFAVRLANGVVYYSQFWWQLDSAVQSEIVIPSAQVGLCNVLVAVTHNGNAVNAAYVTATLTGKCNTVDGLLASKAVETGRTNSQGYCVLTLIQSEEFTRGGIYLLVVADASGKKLYERSVKIPTLSSVNAEKLEDA